MVNYTSRLLVFSNLNSIIGLDYCWKQIKFLKITRVCSVSWVKIPESGVVQSLPVLWKISHNPLEEKKLAVPYSTK